MFSQQWLALIRDLFGFRKNEKKKKKKQHSYRRLELMQLVPTGFLPSANCHCLLAPPLPPGS